MANLRLRVQIQAEDAAALLAGEGRVVLAQPDEEIARRLVTPHPENTVVRRRNKENARRSVHQQTESLTYVPDGEAVLEGEERLIHVVRGVVAHHKAVQRGRLGEVALDADGAAASLLDETLRDVASERIELLRAVGGLAKEHHSLRSRE